MLSLPTSSRIGRDFLELNYSTVFRTVFKWSLALLRYWELILWNVQLSKHSFPHTIL